MKKSRLVVVLRKAKQSEVVVTEDRLCIGQREQRNKLHLAKMMELGERLLISRL